MPAGGTDLGSKQGLGCGMATRPSLSRTGNAASGRPGAERAAGAVQVRPCDSPSRIRVASGHSVPHPTHCACGNPPTVSKSLSMSLSARTGGPSLHPARYPGGMSMSRHLPFTRSSPSGTATATAAAAAAAAAAGERRGASRAGSVPAAATRRAAAAPPHRRPAPARRRRRAMPGRASGGTPTGLPPPPPLRARSAPGGPGPGS